MSIVEQRFINTGASGIEELQGYIEEYNPDIFDDFQVSVDSYGSSLICKKTIDGSSKNVITIRAGSTVKRLKAHTKDGIEAESYISAAADLGWYRSTEHGSIITYTGSNRGNNQYIDRVIIAKDDNGIYIATIMSADGYTPGGVKEYHYHFETSTGLEKVSDIEIHQYMTSIISRSAGKTMVIPMVFSSGVVTDKLLRIIWNEHPGVDGVFELNGRRYITDGYFAIPE